MSKSFRTEIPIMSAPETMKHGQHFLLLGSCFAQHMGGKLSESGHQTAINPLGIQFNPLAISRSVNRLLSGNGYSDSDLFRYDNKWVCFEAHGDFSDVDKQRALDNLNAGLEEGRRALKRADWLFLTLGSAWGYLHKKLGYIVANCHKFPQDTFDKMLCESEQMVDDLSAMMASVWAVNPSVKFVFTVSPVRHWKDGALNNSVGKAHLRIACEKLVSTHKSCHYFPAYELMMDELRDYRFYADDMLHPSSLAVDFIWEKFQTSYMNENTVQFNQKFEALSRLRKHQSASSSHRAQLKRAEMEWAELLENAEK